MVVRWNGSHDDLSGIIPTRHVSEGRMREDVASDVTPSLAYASGCDCYENRNFKTRERGTHAVERPVSLACLCHKTLDGFRRL